MGRNGSEAFEVAAELIKPQGYKRRQWYSRRYGSGHQCHDLFIDRRGADLALHGNGMQTGNASV